MNATVLPYRGWLVGAWSLLCGAALAADWPMYRHDAQRTGATDEPLAFPLAPAWVYTCAQPPTPAWPEQLDVFNRMDFDYAAPLAVADGIVCFGSSADDTVRALDARTGDERWRFTAGGPVRFAPQIAGGRVYFGSDDGRVYCLDAGTGRPIWTFRAGLGPGQMLANGRMVSRWPVRSGVLVDEGVVYSVGGMLSSEGVFAWALKADTGEVLWCNDTLNTGGLSLSDFRQMNVTAKFQGDYSGDGSSPQGALVLGDGVLVIPNGYAGPTPLDRRTGRPLFWAPLGAVGSGGTWMTIDGGRLYTFAKHGLSGNRLAIQDFILTNGAPGAGLSYARLPQLNLYPQLKPGEAHSSGKASAIVRGGTLHAREALGLALAGDVLLLGQDGAVFAEPAAERPAADLRFRVAGGDLAVYASVADLNPARGAPTPADGSGIALFGAAPGGTRIGQLLLVPAVGAEPAGAYRTETGAPVPAPEIRLQTTATSNGYELVALIPLQLLALPTNAADARLEAQVTVGGIDGRPRVGMLFGSTAPRTDARRFGPFKFKPGPGMTSLGLVRDSLKFSRANPVTIRGASAFWSGAVTGEARNLAVADGRLYVSTRSGTIHCFEPAKSRSAAAGSRGRKPAGSAVDSRHSDIARELRADRLDRGYAVVLGDPDGRLAEALAEGTQLHVLCVLTNAAAADRVRGRLLDATAFYGTRIHTLALERIDRLPFPSWFANVVIVAGPMPAVPAKELYRVLRPCGGTLLGPGLTPGEAEAFARASGAAAEEIRPRAGATRIVRGKLEGALDWDSDPAVLTADRLVRWPLQTQWIGGPATRQVRNYLRVFNPGAPGPYLGNGRYAIAGERTLTGVDAYNGAVLWSRPIPQAGATLRLVNGLMYAASETNAIDRGALGRDLWINDDCVVLQLGPECLRGAGAARIKLDAHTGEQLAFYGPYNAPTPVSLRTPQTWALGVDDAHGGTVTMAATATGLVLTLATRDPVVTPVDSWELCFDFRPPDRRYGLYERGAFHAVVTVPQPRDAPRWTPGSGPAHPRAAVSGQLTADGTRTEVVVPWVELEALAGARPTSFGFAATLNSRDGGPGEPIERRHLFGDWTADTINNGWASVALDGSAAGAGARAPAIVAGPADALTDRVSRVTGARSLDPSVWQAPRMHPLTGEPGLKLYRVPTACGGAFFSGTLISGRAGINDFDDDSGMRLVAGVKARCTSPEVIGNGLLLISEESGFCSCNWPLRTSMALAPAAERSHEDWAIFHDRAADTRVRQAFINLGAPGDRRDAAGRLWLGFPRPPPMGMDYSLSAAGVLSATTANGVWMRFWPAALQVPLTVETFGDGDAYRPEDDSQLYMKWLTRWVPNRWQKPLGPQRINADRAAITGTDRPWIYASQHLGIRRAIMQMDFIKPLAAAAASIPPTLDGNLSDPAWAGDPSAELPFTKTELRLRSDADNLYVAARRPALFDRLGAPIAWAAASAGEDAPVWLDDSFELFVGDSARVAHFGISASGARYDALAAGTNTEDRAWGAAWRSAAASDTNGLAFELAIPWKTLAEAGVDRARLGLNVQMNQKDVSGEESSYRGGHGRSNSPRETSGEALCALGWRGRARCAQFAPLGIGVTPPVPERAFTVRLHFAELDVSAKPGQRVFDVRIQGAPALRGFDIVREAGGARRALVKEFKGIKAGQLLDIEFIPATPATPESAPLLSGLELTEE